MQRHTHPGGPGDRFREIGSPGVKAVAPPAARRSVWGWVAGLCATLCIWVAVYTIARLREESDQYQRAGQVLAQIGRVAEREDGLVWRAVQQEGAAETLLLRLAETRRESAQRLEALADLAAVSHAAVGVRSQVYAYQDAVDRRLAAGAGAGMDTALEAEGQRLRAYLRRRGAEIEAVASSRGKAADVGSVLVLIATICATGGVLSLFSRTKREAEASRIAHDQRMASEARFRALVQHSSDVAFVLTPEGRIAYASASVHAVFGTGEEAFQGKSLWEFVHPDDQVAAQAFLSSVTRSMGTGKRQVLRMQAADGRWLHIESLASDLTRDPLIGGVLLNGRDITERILLEQKLSFQALHDPLTGLANRLLFQDRVEQALYHGQRSGDATAVLFIDLDDFKTINDCWGHARGDELLREISARLLRATRGSDSVARLGGDEFAVLLTQVADREDVLAVVQRIDASLQLPVRVGERDVAVTGSIGIALSSEAEGAEEILRNADVAMYVAKGSGKRGWCFFEPAMHARILQRNQLETDLRRAVEHGELRLDFQPLVDLADGQTYGVEALVRWMHPERGLIQPGEFIPIAEDTGLIVPLGRWVLDRGCMQVSRWREMGLSSMPLLLSVNISGRQLQDDEIISDVATALRESGLPPQSLILEITESVLMQNTEATLLRLSALKELGVQLAIDDFGTGYSSLAYLRMFPIDALKIDRRFVSDLEEDDERSGLAKAILSLGDTLGLRTIAEGIETELQRTKLSRLGCQFGQGFYFARPLSPTEVEGHLRAASLALPAAPTDASAAEGAAPIPT